MNTRDQAYANELDNLLRMGYSGDEAKRQALSSVKLRNSKLKESYTNNPITARAQRKYINSFITALMTENYKTANEHLQNAINLKIKSKIASAKNTKLFTNE
jgi:hypothetical protein